MIVSDLDETLCATSRLAIMLTLAENSAPLSFMELRSMTALADGNLHVQTRKLSDVGYLEISKSGSGRRSRTLFRVTDRGLYKLNQKLKQMQRILSQNESFQAQQDSSKRPEDAQFW